MNQRCLDRREVWLERKSKSYWRNRALLSQNRSASKENVVVETPEHQEDSKKQFLSDIIRNMNVPPEARRYSQETYSISLSQCKTSFTSYNKLRDHLPLPSFQSINAKFSETVSLQNDRLLDLSLLPDIIRSWRSSNNVESQKCIPCILSVDALCFKPEVIISNTGEIEGIEGCSSTDLFMHFSQNPDAFAAFLHENWDKTYSAAFAFQLQPLNPKNNNLLLHIQPDTNGKADHEQVCTLNHIRDIVKNQKIVIKGFAFDGDNAYSQLHIDYFNSYCLNVLNNEDSFSKCRKDKCRIISDPLHLLKRARYRLLKIGNGTSMICGFSMDSAVIDLNLIQEYLDLPPVVFSDNQLTKMHDSLPITLFSMRSLFILVSKDYYPGVLYFLPWVLLTASLSNEVLECNVRYDLLEITLYYLLFYLQELEEEFPKIQEHVSQTKNAAKPILVLFNEQLAMESCNTAHSDIMLMRTVNSPIYLNRASSTPLEHSFGKARLKVGHKQKLENLINAFGIEEVLMNIGQLNTSIRGRVQSFGEIVEFSESEYQNSFSFSNKLIAYSLLYLNGGELDADQTQSIRRAFFEELFSIEDIIPQEVAHKQISSRFAFLGTNFGAQRRELMSSKSEGIKLIQPKKINELIPYKVTAKKLANMFGKKSIEMSTLLVLAKELEKQTSIPLSREEKRVKKALLVWFTDNWNELATKITKLSFDNYLLQ